MPVARRRIAPPAAPPLTGVERMRRHRARRRADGRRLVQFWTFDPDDPAIAAKLRAESIEISRRSRARDAAWSDAAWADLNLPPYDAPLRVAKRRR